VTRVRPPVDSPDDRYFWDGVRQHRLLIQRCAGCGTLRHPPSPMCGRCGSTEWDTVESSGQGTVYSWIVSHHPTEPDAEPRIVVLVDLPEGVRVVANLLDVEWPEIRNGMAVVVCFETFEDDVVLPQFRPA
jgi:uncharacterized OB-fold protein